MPSRLIRILNKQYGPYAFGLVSILVLWFTIFAPEREAMKKSSAEFAAVVKESNESQQKIANALLSVSNQLAAVERRLADVEHTLHPSSR